MNAEEVYDEGFQAARSKTENPYELDTEARFMWNMGFLAGLSSGTQDPEYTNRPFSPWEGQMVYSETLQQFFQNPEELVDYVRDEGLEMPKNLKLVICEPERWRLLDSNYWYNDAEDFGSDIPEELEDAIEALNRVVRSLPVANWCPGRYRTEMPCAK